MPATLSSLPGVTLESKVAFLRHSGSYPEPAYRVEALETHMSWVFLAGAYVYKLKKPVCYELLDFRTLEARRFYCEEEVRLNRRLAAQVYLGTVPLTLDAHAHLQLDGRGTPIDWLVKMWRLPARQMLDYAIVHQSVQDADFERVAVHLAAFYRACEPVPTDPVRYRARLQRQIESNRQELGLDLYRLPRAQVDAICQAQAAALERMAGLFDARVRANRVIEGHGDLRPEHICLRPHLAIIDCLEFSRELRLVDPADELAFLALECERLGAAAAGATLLARYGALSGDVPDARLVHFYQSYRAGMRATISARHLQEEKFRYSPQWIKRTGQYLQLADQHVGHCA